MITSHKGLDFLKGTVITTNFSWRNAIQPPLFWFSKPALFAASGL